MPLQQNNIHDKFFKETFSFVREVRAFITHFLDKKLWEKLDLDSLELENGSYTDEELKEYFADIIYTCRRDDGKKVQLTFLFEHKSYYDKGLSLQLLDYLNKGYRRQYRENPKQELGYILPILLYHGKQKWRKRELADMMNFPDIELNPYLPTFKYEVVDLGRIADSILLSEISGVLLPPTLLLFKYKDDKNFVLKNSVELFTFVERELSNYEKKRLILTIVRYIFAVHQLNQEEIKTFNQKLKPMTQAIVGSYADTLFKQGQAEGMAKGMEKGMEKGVVLSSIKILCNLFKIFPSYTDEQITQIAKCSTKMTKELRLLLKKTSEKKAGEVVYQKYFKDLELTGKQKTQLFKDIAEYYKKSEK